MFLYVLVRHITWATCVSTNVLAIRHSQRRVLDTVNVFRQTTRRSVSAMRRLRGRASIVRVTPNLPVLGMGGATPMLPAPVIISGRLPTNIGPAVLVKNVKNIGTVVNVICAVTPTAIILQINFRSVLRHKTV